MYLGEGVRKGGRSAVVVGCSVWDEEDGAFLAALCPRTLPMKTDLHHRKLCIETEIYM